jgi:multiple sugar transport system permease protein
MTFNTRADMRPMTAAIYNFMNQYGTKWNSIMAYGVLLILPTCIIFVTMQKHIVSGLVSGSVKG